MSASAIQKDQTLRADPEAFTRAALKLASIIDALGSEQLSGQEVDTLMNELLASLDYNGHALCEVTKERYSARIEKPGADFQLEYGAAQLAWAAIQSWADAKRIEWRSRCLSAPAQVELVARERVKAVMNDEESVRDLAEALITGPEPERLAACRVVDEHLRSPQQGMAYGALVALARDVRPPDVQAADDILEQLAEARKDTGLMAQIFQSYQNDLAKREAAAQDRANALRELEDARQMRRIRSGRDV